MPETTTEPTALADLAARWERQSVEYLTDWQDYDSHDGQERCGQGIALADAASELRAALAAAPADCDLGERIASAIERDEEQQHDALDREGPQPGHDYLRGYRTAVAACAEIAREVAGRSVSPDDAHTSNRLLDIDRDTVIEDAVASAVNLAGVRPGSTFDEIRAAQHEAELIEGVATTAVQAALNRLGMFPYAVTFGPARQLPLVDKPVSSRADHVEWVTVGTDGDGDEGAETFASEADAEAAADRWRRMGMTGVYVERHDVSTTRTVTTSRRESEWKATDQ